jgi:hypothetical protein
MVHPESKPNVSFNKEQWTFLEAWDRRCLTEVV